ncbi:glycosyltransferase [Streptomyces hygroscopicus]|uniref:glycosyltransferase n=1 Tax=Streptomyces hygroscopicus TaxID=1912 RepID=UPI0008250584|nr:glycosyltransferase [Streptomyces hygroscopicus]
MRVLFTTTPAPGHFHPLLPLASAARAAGHEVAFATGRPISDLAEAMGFRTFEAGLSRDGDQDAEFLELKKSARGLPPTGIEMDRIAIARVLYGVRTRRMVPDLLALARMWRPDVVVRDSYEVGGAVAAECLGVPHAALDTTPLYDMSPLRGDIQRELDQAREEAGLAPDPEQRMLHRHLHLCCAPPSYLPSGRSRPATLRALRPMPFDRADGEELPDWVRRLPDRPLVYVTFGTITNRWVPGAFPGLFSAVLRAFEDEPVNVVATVDRDSDPADLGPQPPHIRVERYIPQSLLLPLCAAAVTHGGFNTVVGAFHAGIPQIVVPFLGDHPYNARRCAELGLARVVDPAELTTEGVREAVREVMTAPEYRAGAQRMRAELRELPGPREAVGLLERLAAGKGLEDHV